MQLKPAKIEYTPDGKLISPLFDDIYFQPENSVAESRYVFIEQNNLPYRFKELGQFKEPNAPVFRICEFGFGTGLNFLLTWKIWMETATANARLDFISFEKHPLTQQDFENISNHCKDIAPLASQLAQDWPEMVPGIQKRSFEAGRIRLTLFYGDINENLAELETSIDAWYLDGFAPSKNPDMWKPGLFDLMAEKSAPQASFATFTAAGDVRRGLEKAGFVVAKSKGYGKKRDMLTGSIDKPPQPPVLQSNIFYMPPKAQTPQTVAIIGSGIAGSALAHAFATRGIDTQIIDENPDIAQAASGNPVGIVYPSHSAEPSPLGMLYSHGFLYTRYLIKSLQKALSEDLWHECGVIQMDISEEKAAKHSKVAKNLPWPEKLLSYRRLDNYSKSMGLHHPVAGYLNPVKFCKALADHKKITFTHSVKVAELKKTQNKWRLLDGQGTEIAAADIVIIAGGHRAAHFTQTADLPLQTLRGQITYLPASETSQNLNTVICHNGYIAPAIDNVHCIGATFEKDAPEDDAVTQEAHQHNIAQLNKYLPALNLNSDNIKPLGGRTAFRATTPDKLPMIGPCPDHNWFKTAYAGLSAGVKTGFPPPQYHDGLYISTGFGSHGFCAAPLAAEMLASMITGDALPIAKSILPAFMPARFIIRRLKRPS